MAPTLQGFMAVKDIVVGAKRSGTTGVTPTFRGVNVGFFAAGDLCIHGKATVSASRKNECAGEAEGDT